MEIINSEDRIVAGWANVEVLDMQGEIIPINLLKDAMLKYMDMGGPIILAHSNKQVGKVLQWEIRKHPVTKTDGLWIVAKIDKIYPTHDEVWEMIKRGEFKGFSVGGRGKRKVLKVKPEFKDRGLPEEVKVLENLELFEISLAPTPANPYATIEAISMAKAYEEKKRLTLEELIEKYKVKKEELILGDGCALCKFVKTIYEESGDLDAAVNIGYILFKRELEKQAKRSEMMGRLFESMEKLSETLKQLSKPKPPERGPELDKEEWKEKLKLIMEQVEGYVAKLKDEVSKPFAAWDSFDDCVSDMKSKGYGEDSAKRICGSLQAKYEKADIKKWHQFADEAREHLEMAIEALETSGSDKFDEVLSCLADALDSLHEIILEEVGEEGIDEEGEEAEVEEALIKDKRPPKKWWDRCIERTGRPALCGWVYYHHLKPYKPKSKREKDEPHTQEARERKRKYGL